MTRTADCADLRSPETHIGHDNADSFASPSGATRGRPHAYEVPDDLALNTWALGARGPSRETARLERPNGRIAHRFHSHDVKLVMRPAVREASPSRFASCSMESRLGRLMEQTSTPKAAAL